MKRPLPETPEYAGCIVWLLAAVVTLAFWTGLLVWFF